MSGLDAFPRSEWPDNIPLLYFSYHIMVGLGTIFMAVMLVAAWLLWRRRLFEARWMLWILLLSFPLPFIANTAGWVTAEIGRQPYLVYGLYAPPTDIPSRFQRAMAGSRCSASWECIMLSILFLFLMHREIEHGPEARQVPAIADGGAGPQAGVK